jgi:hypothetical protein
MFDKPPKDGLYGLAPPHPRGQSPVIPRPGDGGPPGRGDSLERYRRFFETHDLHGLPQRDARTKG